MSENHKKKEIFGNFYNLFILTFYFMPVTSKIASHFHEDTTE